MQKPQPPVKSSPAVSMAVSLILALSKPAMGESPDKADPRHHAPISALLGSDDGTWQDFATPEDPFLPIMAQINAGQYVPGNPYV